MNVVLEMMDFALEMMNFVLEMTNFVGADAGVREGLRAGDGIQAALLHEEPRETTVRHHFQTQKHYENSTKQYKNATPRRAAPPSQCGSKGNTLGRPLIL